jgi:hypothetical protein
MAADFVKLDIQVDSFCFSLSMDEHFVYMGHKLFIVIGSISSILHLPVK